MLTINPGDHGLFERSRIAIVDRRTKVLVRKEEIPAAGVFSLVPDALDPAGDYAFKLQVQSDGKWTDATPYRKLYRDFSYVCDREAVAAYGASVTVIDPAAHGVHADCRVSIYNTFSRRHFLEQPVAAHEVVALPNAFFDGLASYRFELRVQTDGKWHSVGPMRALTPTTLRNRQKIDFRQHRGELAYTERAAVTIGPYVSYPGSAAQTIEGFVRVHQDGEPVPEALRVTMGKQGHLMLPCEEAEVAQDGTFIYAGILNPSYGHFITEGVARLWYAREHPELPIIWHSRADALSEMQLTILGILGIRNPHVFVRKPTRYANVVFPLPGAGLGSYFLKEQGEFMGVVEPASMVPGKKIYLSRGRLGGARGISEHDDAIEAMLREQGFTIYHPERHSILEQLAEISSAGLVVGIEGSALHSVLFLKAPIRTRFIAIARHRMGEGAFEHIRQAKGIDYRTINVRTHNASLAASAPLDIDVALLSRLIAQTRGFSIDLDALRPYTTAPDPVQASYREALKGFRTGMTDLELALVEAIRQLQRKDGDAALKILLPMFQAIKVA